MKGKAGWSDSPWEEWRDFFSAEEGREMDNSREEGMTVILGLEERIWNILLHETTLKSLSY